MNYWQKILKLLENAEYKDKQGNKNLLIGVIAEYLYSVLGCFKEDLDKKEILISDEKIEKILSKWSGEITEIQKAKYKMLGIYEEIEIKRGKVLEKKELFQNNEINRYLESPSLFKQHKIKKYDFKILHQEVCKKIFKNIGDGLSKTWVGIDVDIEEDESGEENSHLFGRDNTVALEGIRGYKLSMISEEILNYDGHIFSLLDSEGEIKEIIKELYRPYFVEYYIDTTRLNSIQKEFLQQMYHEKGWYEAKLTSDVGEIELGDKIVFEGMFVYSASPIKFVERNLKIQDKKIAQEVAEKINRIYDMDIKYDSEDEIQKKLKSLFRGVTFYYSKVYKVGNGNCIYNYCKIGNKLRRFYYDIGFDIRTRIWMGSNNTKIVQHPTLNSIKNSIPYCVILSHWDADHYRAYVSARKEIFNIKWITPNIEKKEKKENAKRLFLYLYLINSLIPIKRGKEKEIIVWNDMNSRMVLYMGEKRRGIDKAITKCNCEGIALFIENKISQVRCLMQGDVPYMSLPSKVNFSNENPYDYLVVPHHGAKMDCSLLMKAMRKSGKAVICCTDNIIKNRPNKAHSNYLKASYDTVECTEKANHYIKLDFKKKNGMLIV